MATNDLKNKLAKKTEGSGIVNTRQTVNSLLSDDKIKNRFEKLLGNKAQGFMSSIINVVNGNTDLVECDPNTVLGSAAVAASLDLPIDPNLGFSYIIPYNVKVNGRYIKKAQFQMGYKGFVQLAMRTGAYKTISATEIYEGEITHFNRVTSDIEFGEAKSQKVVGYIAYFRLLNGFEKYLYMSKEEVEKHAKTYSKTYESEYGIWKKNFDSMATKTVLKMLLSKYGMLSIEMNNAMVNDQAVIKIDGESEIGEKEEVPPIISDSKIDYVDTPFIETDEQIGLDMAKNEMALTVMDKEIEAQMETQINKDIIEKSKETKTKKNTRKNTKKSTTSKDNMTKVK